MALKTNEVWMLTQILKEIQGHPKYSAIKQMAEGELDKHDAAARDELFPPSRLIPKARPAEPEAEAPAKKEYERKV